MAGPPAAVPEHDGRDAVVALAHHEVRKPGNLVHDRLLGDLQDVPEQIGIAPEVPDCR